MYVAIHRGRVVVATSHRQTSGRRSTGGTSSNVGGGSRTFTPACFRTWSEINDLMYAPKTKTPTGPAACTGIQMQGGRYAGFACAFSPDESQEVDAEALGLLVAAYLSGCATTACSDSDKLSDDPPRDFLRTAVALEALLRVGDGDLLLGSSGGGEHHLIVAHLRQGRVVGVQDLGLHFGSDGSGGGSLLLRCVHI